MARARGITVLVATDGSATGRAALAAALAFPWPRGSRARGVVARSRPVAAAEWPALVWEALARETARTAARARRALRRRWPRAEVLVVDRSPVEAILGEARRVRAGAVVVGSRGHGAIGRLLLGSVSRAVVRHASCATLVVRGRTRQPRQLVLGLDGSANAARAVELVARLSPGAGARVTVVRVVEPVRPPSMALMPGRVRATLLRELRSLEAQQLRHVRRSVEVAARRLGRAGWRATPLVRVGAPLDELLATIEATRADLLVVGARGAGAVRRLLLGSVAEGALGRARTPVLVVR